MNTFKVGDLVIPNKFEKDWNPNMEIFIGKEGVVAGHSVDGDFRVHNWYWPASALTLVPANTVPEPKFGEWISVEDRLPENSNNVLCFSDRNEYYIAYKCENPEIKNFMVDVKYHGKVTHWMPLPPVPSPQSNPEINIKEHFNDIANGREDENITRKIIEQSNKEEQVSIAQEVCTEHKWGRFGEDFIFQCVKCGAPKPVEQLPIEDKAIGFADFIRDFYSPTEDNKFWMRNANGMQKGDIPDCNLYETKDLLDLYLQSLKQTP